MWSRLSTLAEYSHQGSRDEVVVTPGHCKSAAMKAAYVGSTIAESHLAEHTTVYFTQLVAQQPQTTSRHKAQTAQIQHAPCLVPTGCLQHKAQPNTCLPSAELTSGQQHTAAASARVCMSHVLGSLDIVPVRRARAVIAVVERELLAGPDVLRRQDGHAVVALHQHHLRAAVGLRAAQPDSLLSRVCIGLHVAGCQAAPPAHPCRHLPNKSRRCQPCA